MSVITKIEELVFESRTMFFVIMLFLIMLFKTGIWYIPSIGASQLIAQNPFINPFHNQNEHYILWSWLGPFLAWLVGATGKWHFFLFHLAFSAAFSALFFKAAFSLFPNEKARIVTLIFCALPVASTAFFWVSMDSITLFLMLIALTWIRYPIVTFIVGVLLGMQHFEQAFCGTLGLLLATYLSKKQNTPTTYSLRFCIFLLTGVIGGKLALLGIFQLYSIEVNSGRIYWLRKNFWGLLGQFFFHFHVIVWSVLGMGWIVALKYFDKGRESIPFFVSLFGLCFLLPISEDQTRVFAIASFPLIVAYWLFNNDFIQNISRKEASYLFVLWVIVPWSWVWKGMPKWSVFPYDIAFFLHRLLGWFDIPQNPSEWPFF